MGKREMVKLGDVCSLITKGTTPTTLGYNFEEYGVNFIKVESISENGAFIKEKIQYISGKCNEKLKRSQLKENDVLFSIAGALGRTAIVTRDILPANTNQALAIIRLDSTILNLNYVLKVLNSSDIFKQFQKQKQGVAQLNLSLKNIADFLIPLPPLDEQKRIAKNLDLASEIVKGYKEQIAELDKLVQSVFYEMFGDPLLNPFVFPISTLDNLADVVSGITKGRKLGNSQQLFEVPYMAVSNVKAGYIDWTTVKTITATQEEIERYRIFENDILMTEGGDPDKLGRGSIINQVPQNCIHQNHIFRVRCKTEGVIPRYFSEYLKHAGAKQYFLRCAKQTTGIASINMTQLRSLPVIVPPLPLQTRFATIVTEIEAQKAQVQQALTEAESLFNSLMQEYFE